MSSPSNKSPTLNKRSLLTDSPLAPPRRNNSIISNLMAKAEKQPNLKRLSIIKDSTKNTSPHSSILKNDVRRSLLLSLSNFNTPSIVHPSSALTKKNNEENKSGSHHNLNDKDKGFVIEDPDVALLDVTRLLKRKRYRRAYRICEKFLSSKRIFRLFFELRYNRMHVVTINKICKIKFIKNQLNHPRFIHKLLIKGLYAMMNFCNFLTIFFHKKYPKFPKKIVINEQDCDPYLSFNEDLKKIPKKFEKMHNPIQRILSKGHIENTRKISTNSSLENLNEKIESKSLFERLFDGDFREDDEYFDKVMEREYYKLKNIDDQTETYFFVKNLLELMMYFALVYRNMGVHKTSYNYMVCIDDISRTFESTINPDLLHTLIKCKYLYGLFFMQFQKHEESLKILEKALSLCQKELIVRINMNNYMKDIKRKLRMKYLTCIRTIVMVLNSICQCYAFQKNYQKMFETLSLSRMFSSKFLQRIDEIKKHTFSAKLYNDITECVMPFYQEMSEMEKLISELLIDNPSFQKKLKEANEIKIQDPLQEINTKLYYKFGWNVVNKNKFIFFPAKYQKNNSKTYFRKDSCASARRNLNTSKLHKKSSIYDENLFTRATTETNEPMVSSIYDILNGKSFLKDEENSNLDLFSNESSMICCDNPFLSLNLKTYSQTMEQKSKYFSNKNVVENLPDYKPKVLTTTRYFKKFKYNLDEEENKEYSEQENFNNNYHKVIKTEESQPDQNHGDKDLDFHMKTMICDNFNRKCSSKNVNKIDEDFLKHLKKEDFDKKEFSYCKKMLLMKRDENCSVKSPEHIKQKYNKINKITANNVVEKEANVIEGKITSERQANTLRQTIKQKYQNFFTDQIEEDDKESVNEKIHETKPPKIVSLILKHKNALKMNKVARNYEEILKDKEKIRKKNQEINMKQQSKLNKKREWYNFKSINTLKHLLENKASQSLYFNNKSHRSRKKSWISYKSTFSSLAGSMRSGNLNSKKTEKMQNLASKSIIPLSPAEKEKEEVIIAKNFEKAQDIIKLFSEDLEEMKEGENNSKQKMIKRPKSLNFLKVDYNKPLSDIAKSAFYLSLDQNNNKKIMNFADLVKIKAKQHFKGTMSFFGNSVFGTSFK